MRVYVDLDTQKLIQGPGQGQEVTLLRLKRSPTFKLEVQFVRNSVIQELADDATGLFEIKDPDKFDQDPALTGAGAWVKSGDGETTVYTFTVALTTAGLNTRFHVDGNDSNDIAELTLMAGIQWNEGGSISETPTLTVKIQNDVVREGDTIEDMPPFAYAVFPDGITSLVDFRALPTTNMVLGYIVQILIVVSGQLSWLTYRLVTGPTTDVEPGQVEPDDYDAMDNDVHWEGAVGPSGAAGEPAGVEYKWNTNTAATDPTSGHLKVNNATLASATLLHISETDNDSRALAAMIATWDDGTSTIKGRLLIQDPATIANFLILDISGTITDNGTWDTFSVAYVSTGGTLTNNLPVRLFFYPKGDKGDTGATGGLKYLFNSATSLDPTAGKFLFDHATFLSATHMLISETDGNANAVAAFLAAQDDGTSSLKCLVVAQNQTGTALFSFWINGVLTDNGAYDTFPITPITKVGSISNGDTMFLTFARVGDVGSVGPTGATGREAALQYLWNTNTAATDPTAGHLKFDSATLSSAVLLHISETDNDTNALAALLATWDDGTSTIKGKLFIHSPATPTIFAVFNITGTLTDNGTWDTFSVAHVASGGSFTNNLPVTAVFVPKGDVGASGATSYPASVAIAAGSSQNIDWSLLTTTQLRTLGANTTFTHINMVDGKVIVIPVLNTASNYTLTWVGVDYWQTAGGTAPPQSVGAVVDLWTFYYDGTKLYATWAPGT